MERIKIIIHKDNRIIMLDAKNLSEDELCEAIAKNTDAAIQNKINLLMMDLTGTRSTKRVKEAASKATERSIAALGTTYLAIIGLSSLQRLIANAIGRNNYFASDIEDAKEWLVNKAKKAS